MNPARGPHHPHHSAERNLLAAAHVGEECDLRTNTERADLGWVPTAADAASWGEDRTVRADYQHHLLVEQQLPVHLTSARIHGDLDLSGQDIALSLQQCVLPSNARFTGATFTGTAQFERARFRVLHWIGTRWSAGSALTAGLAAERVVLDRSVVE